MGPSQSRPNPKHVRIFTCVHFYFAGKYLRRQCFAYIAHNEEDPWGAYLELDELDSIAVYKAHVKSSMNPGLDL
jgi:hypothetical protein